MKRNSSKALTLTSLLAAGTLFGQTYVERTGENNPFNSFNVFGSSAPVVVNFDGDTDLDVVIGEGGGKFWFYKNDGGSYTAIRGTDGSSPFNWLDVGTSSTPTFVDVDGDNDLDLVSGEGFSGTIKYYNNDAGAFAEKTGSDNPFDGLSVSANSAPTFADVDGDNDMDLVVGNGNGDFAYFQNNGNVYTEKTGSDNPFNGLNSGGNAKPVLVDVDGDNDLDLVSGETWSGLIVYFENVAGVYTQKKGTDNPFNGFTSNGGFYSAPTFADVDSDGDLDLLSGDNNGKISYFENTSPITSVGKVLSSNTFVYPNPTSGIVNVDNGLYKVYSTLGAELLSTYVANGKLDLSTLPAGQYVVRNQEKSSLVVKN